MQSCSFFFFFFGEFALILCNQIIVPMLTSCLFVIMASSTDPYLAWSHCQFVVKIVVMAAVHKGIAVVIMGVSGAGKSTIGEMLGKALNCRFIDADDFHPQSNKEKMKQGIPLSDEDRTPWLEVLRDVVNANLVSGKTVILGCSALQKQYRDILRSADPDHQGGPHDPCVVKFVLLDVGVNLLMDRVQKRAAEGKHFMPVELLQSQIDLLQVDDSEGVFKVDASLTPEAIVDDIKRSLF